MRILFAFLVSGCAVSANTISSDAGEQDIAPKLELVCASNFCGNITDKSIGITTDCGSCPIGSQCNDNNISNICGSSCLPFPSPDGGTEMPACNYGLGAGWYADYLATGGIQVASACNYTNPEVCIPINIPEPATGICSGEVCGNWYCCLTGGQNPVNPFLPGANGEDGGT